MKILLCHTRYQQRGGEDESFDAEARLLESRGHQVLRYVLHNDALAAMSCWAAARRTFFNGEAYRQLKELCRGKRPAVMHCTNTFPLISPAAYYAARAAGVPVVQSLRNYRMMCVNGYLLRDQQVCERCVGRTWAWPGVRHACYRGSRAASAVVAGMLAVHRLAGTWRRLVDRYFTLTEFARQKFIAAGLPADRIAVKPNFLPCDPGPGDGRGGYALFAGRLSAEKGIDTLLAGWERLEGRLPLKIVGDGPLRRTVQEAAARLPGVEWLGFRPAEQVLELMGGAAMLVMPSIWYETFGRTVMEAFATGTPVVASRLGAMAELVEEGRTGWLFEPGSAEGLAACVQRVLEARDPGPMRRAARRQFEDRFTADRNYRLLLDVYRQAAARRGLSLPQETTARGREDLLSEVPR